VETAEPEQERATSRGRRGLSTAREVLRVLALLQAHPEGVRADDVARLVGKSTSTAYYLLVSLCDEGFAVHERDGRYRVDTRAQALALEPETTPLADDGARAVEALFARTRKRSYLGVVRGGVIEITVVRGRQGVAKMPGLGTQIRDNAHALAMGKVVLARLPEAALARYARRGLPRYTPSTITDPDVLASELEHVRSQGFAVEREEFDEDFCCVAAPALDSRGRLRGVLGLSTTVRAFDREQEALAEAVSNIVRNSTSFFPGAASGPSVPSRTTPRGGIAT
jgi:DNA-binding IclR family transcriptional regulator